jgi:glutamine amidotransferase
MIKVVSYGSGNVNAITNIYKRLNIPCEVASNHHQLTSATKLVLPGVGAFDQTMRLINNSGMREHIEILVLQEKVPILGVCVGMQIMARRSDEGTSAGLGWVDGAVERLDTSELRHRPHLPHMGWNRIHRTHNAPILNNVDDSRGFYFLHSYCFKCDNSSNILATSSYGREFTAAIVSGNIFGFQFHPEKSHQNGIHVFKNFAELS